MAKILVADDSITEREYIRKSLQIDNHEVTAVENGEKAIQKLKEESFECVILDVVMPGKNGYQICRDIKKDDFTKDIPVILVTSKNQESDKFWGMKQGADDYITKPFETSDLLNAVKRLLK